MSKRIHVRDFAGVKDITLKPAGNLVVIAGANGAGKSSLMNAISELFNSKGVKLFPKPIREGADEAYAEYVDEDLGLRVSRTWRKNDSGKLEVTALDGAKYSRPSEVIARLTGGLLFDPVEFLNLDDRKQREALLAKVELPFDLDTLAREKAGAEDRRLEAGRDVKRLQGALASMENPADAPDEEVAAVEIFDQIQKAQGLAHTHEQEKARLEEMSAESARLAAQIADLTAKLELLGSAITAQTAAIAELPQVPDVAPLQAKLAEVDQVNAAVRAKREYRKVAGELAKFEANHAVAAAELAQIEVTKIAGLSAAQFPVDGLSVDDNGVTFEGVPFIQVNSAHRMRVAFAVATSGNPELKLVIVRNGDLLDSASLQVLADMADDRGYTVLVERDRDESRDIGFTVQDGVLAEAVE